MGAPLAFVGEAGNAIIFMCATVGAGLMLLYFLAYLGRCFLVTLDGTAAGAEEVTWPDEPVYDWVWKSLFLGWLLAFWAVPLSLCGLIAAGLFRLSVPAFLVVLAGLLWLAFPASLLSCLSGQSWVHVLRWPILAGMARHWRPVLWMYAVGGILLAGAGGLVYFALTTNQSWYWLAVAAPVLSAAMLIVARLLGRVAWLIGQKSVEAERRRDRRARNRPVKAQVADPWAVEEQAEDVDLEPLADDVPAPVPAPAAADPEDEWAPPTAYGLDAPAAAAPAAPLRPFIERAVPEAEQEGYRMAAETEPRTVPPVPLDGSRPVGEDAPPAARRKRKGAKREVAADVRLPRPKPPRWPLVQGVFLYPWQSDAMGGWFYLAVLAFFHLLLVKTALLWWPAGY